MRKWINVVFAIATCGEILVAEETIAPTKAGDLVTLELVGDAPRTYARVDRLSLDKAASQIPVLWIHAVISNVDSESVVSVEHRHEAMIDGERYLYLVSGSVPAAAIDHVRMLDWGTLEKPQRTTEQTAKPKQHNTRLSITDFQAFPDLKVQRWKLNSENAGDDTPALGK